jgi:hypothetical protein
MARRMLSPRQASAKKEAGVPGEPLHPLATTMLFAVNKFL